jgi:hypothetical protein
MRFGVILLFMLSVVLRAVADPYLLFSEKGKIGLKDGAGKVVLPAAFEALGWSDGSFSVAGEVTGYKLKDRWGLINLKKEYLSSAEYENMTYPGGDRVIARKAINAVQVKAGCLNLRGEVSVAFVYDGIQIMGLRAIVFNKLGPNYVFGLIDLTGHEVIPLNYKNIYPLGTLRYAVENEKGKIALFSEEGKAITDFKIDSISSFRNNLAVIYQELNQGLIDREGEIRIEAQYREIRIEADGSIDSRMQDEWKVLNAENHEIRKVEADDLVPIGENLYRISKTRRQGIVDDEFKTVFPLDYSYIGSVDDKKIVAAKQGKFGILRLSGSVVLPFQYDSLLLEGKYVTVREDLLGKSYWSIYDTFGIRKTQKQYDFIAPLHGKLFPAKKNGYWGALNRYGEESVHCVFDSLLEISNEQVAVKFKGLYGIINIREDWLVPPQPDRVALINSNVYLLYSGNMVFLKDFFNNVIYFTDNKISCKTDYLVEALPDGTQKQVDYNGRLLVRSAPFPSETTSDKIFQESEGLRGILKDGKYGFVDSRGRLRIANRYDGIGLFKDGLAPVKIISKWGYIDKSEHIIIQPSYESAAEFSGRMALVKRAGKYGLLDTTGKQVIDLRYDSIVVLPNQRYELYSGGLQGLAGSNGKILIDPRFNRLEDLNNGYVLIHRDGKFGLLTIDGISTIPLIYDRLVYDNDKNQYLALRKSQWRKLVVGK